MKKVLIFLFSLLLSGAMLLISKDNVFASEGTFELRSTNQNTYRCFAASLQMQNLIYQVTVSCREIVYPVDETIFSYILWANPVDGSKPVKLGPITLGEEGTTRPKQSTTSQPSVRDRLLTGLKRAGLASALALVAILGLVFVLTRP